MSFGSLSNLPPGCSDADIELALLRQPIIQEDYLMDNDIDFCPNCGKDIVRHDRSADCLNCGWGKSEYYPPDDEEDFS